MDRQLRSYGSLFRVRVHSMRDFQFTTITLLLHRHSTPRRDLNYLNLIGLIKLLALLRIDLPILH